MVAEVGSKRWTPKKDDFSYRNSSTHLACVAVCAAVKSSVWELIGTMYPWDLKTRTKRREKQEDYSVQIDGFAWHLIFVQGTQTLCSAEIKGRCYLLWRGPTKRSPCLTSVLFGNLKNWQKLSWSGTEACADKTQKIKKTTNRIWSSLVYLTWICWSQRQPKKEISHWRTTVPLGIYSAIWIDF